jgi:hypothetical protein
MKSSESEKESSKFNFSGMSIRKTKKEISFENLIDHLNQSSPMFGKFSPAKP